MAHKHKKITTTKKYEVEVCSKKRDDFVVLRLWSGRRRKTVYHHLTPKEALLLAQCLEAAANSKPK